MAIKINIPLTSNSGLNIPSGAVVVSQLGFPLPLSELTEDSKYIPNRIIEWGMHVFINLEAYLTSKSPTPVQEFKVNYKKQMTPAEYLGILGNGAHSEVWLKSYLEGILGEDTCEIIDPFT
jgi:hypothetical protein